MKLVGQIVKLQIQRSGLKVPNPAGSAHGRRFHTDPLLEVPALLLTPQGVLGLVPDGDQPKIDVHHVAHAESRNSQGLNGVSIGFTSHYVAIRERFGSHLHDGAAGENILVESDQTISEGMLAGGVAIQTQDGLVHLERLMVAEPCVEFTRFALQLGPGDPSDERVTDGLRFLRAGTRGFYATFAGSRATVRTGDSMFVRD